MTQGYRQLRYEDRILIYSQWKLGVPQASIARAIGCHRSTISRELRGLKLTDRNEHHYILAEKRHAAVMSRKSQSRSESRRIDRNVWQIVHSKLKDERWSPEQISLWLKNNLPEYYISHQSIYNYIKDIHPKW